jgi:hypothetical protein
MSSVRARIRGQVTLPGACWWIIAAMVDEWPIRVMISFSFAPDWAAGGSRCESIRR